MDQPEDVEKLSEAQGLIDSLETGEYPPNVQASIGRASEAVEDAVIEVQLYHDEQRD